MKVVNILGSGLTPGQAVRNMHRELLLIAGVSIVECYDRRNQLYRGE
jgi:hypothetical protein